MIAAKNYDVICFQLRNNLNSQLDDSLKVDLKHLSSIIKALIISKGNIKKQSVKVLGQVFNLRVKALTWIAQKPNFEYQEVFKDAFLEIEKMRSDKRLMVLTENILFAMRCNQRVIESVSDTHYISSETFGSDFVQSEITYQQFVTSLAFANLDDINTQRILDWTNASLCIEFVLFAADIISDEKLEISEKKINELAFLAADAAQEYTALAIELGLLKPKSTTSRSLNDPILDNSFLDEQKQLAELGIDDFAKNF